MNTPILRNLEFHNAVRRILTPQSPGGRPLHPDMGFISDRHPFFEVLVALEGRCEYPIAGQLFDLTAGTAVLLPPWCLHSFGYRPCDTELLHVWIRFHGVCNGSGIRVHRGNWTICPELSFQLSPECGTLFQMRWEAWEKNGRPGMERLFFQNILNSALDEMLLRRLEDAAARRDVVQETLALIRSSHGHGCTLEMLATQARCSKYHLAHRVKCETGRTIGSFIEEARLHYVHSAREHGLSQKEIAWNLGFASGASFWNWYHRHQGDSGEHPAEP